MVMNSKKHNNIYELSRQIEEEDCRAYEVEAKKIINAYREVQQLKGTKTKQKPHKQQVPKEKPQSAYSLKVKETLSQLKSNKAKEAQHLSKHIIQPAAREVPRAYDRKLYRAGLDRLYPVLQSSCKKSIRIGWNSIKVFVQKEDEKEQYFIVRFRIFKLFRAWKNQVLISKQMQQNKKQSQMQAFQMAKQFRAFTLLKKGFNGWQIVAKREARKKAYQKQLRRMQIEKATKKQEKAPKKKLAQQNEQLQSKLRGFLDGLKDKIQHKDRLRTIKQHTEESDPNLKVAQELIQQQMFQENHEEQEQQELQQDENSREVVIQPPNHSGPKKPMTNQQLDKKRKQLQNKHKKRKQALSKIKEEREKKKKQEEQQRMELEKEIEAQQSKIKQERYKQFLKNKKEEEIWEKRQKQLQITANQFNRKRILKYYGWIQLSKIKETKKNQGQILYQTLLLILYRVKGVKFLENINIVASLELELQYERMNKRYLRQLMAKAVSGLWQNRNKQLELKAEYEVRHQVNQIKIFFASWKRITPELAMENFDWQRPRVKRADEFHRLQLLIKGVKALQQNQQQEQKDRLISEQKNRLKNKIKNMLGDEEEINIDQLL